MIFAPGLQFITGRLLPLVPLNAVEWEKASCEARNYLRRRRRRRRRRKKLTKDRRDNTNMHSCHLRKSNTSFRSSFRSRVKVCSTYDIDPSTDIRDKVFDA